MDFAMLRRIPPSFLPALFCIALALPACTAAARTAAGGRDVAFDALPKEAQATLALIRRGGPFPYDRDGVAFGNRERRLPAKSRGYYREYTVRTPGVTTRGARRVVCGGPARAPDACWYTDDHYESFRRIRE